MCAGHRLRPISRGAVESDAAAGRSASALAPPSDIRTATRHSRLPDQLRGGGPTTTGIDRQTSAGCNRDVRACRPKQSYSDRNAGAQSDLARLSRYGSQDPAAHQHRAGRKQPARAGAFCAAWGRGAHERFACAIVAGCRYVPMQLRLLARVGTTITGGRSSRRGVCSYPQHAPSLENQRSHENP